MVLDSIIRTLPIPDPRPARADKDERAKRKQWEKDHPHFKMQEFGLKAGVLALMGAVALYPWEKKKYEEHVRERHPERLEQGSGEGRRERGSWDGNGSGSGRRRNSVDERRRGGDGGREGRDGSGGKRGRSVAGERTTRAPANVGVRRVVTEDIRLPNQRRSIDARSLRLAVAEGYEYVPARSDGRRSVDRRDRRRHSDVFSGEKRRDGLAEEESGRDQRGSGEVRFQL